MYESTRTAAEVRRECMSVIIGSINDLEGTDQRRLVVEVRGFVNDYMRKTARILRERKD